MEKQSVDIVLVTQNRTDLLRRCLGSLKEAAKAADVAVSLRICSSGGSIRSSREIEDLLESTPFQSLQIEISPRPLKAGTARNLLLESCRADWIFFIDDDAFVEPDFFLRFARAASEWADADAVGGPNLTPRDSSPFQRASGEVLGSRFGAARSAARYAPLRSARGSCGEAELTSCNLFVRRRALRRARFAETLVSGEENWLMQDMASEGRKLVYEEKLFVWHERRRNFRQFLRQVHAYGVGRGQSGRLRPATLRWFHLVPALALLAIVLGAPALIFFDRARLTLLTLTAAYALLSIAATVKLSRRGSTPARVGLISWLLFPCLHIAYGAGVLRGLTVRA